MRTSDEDGQLLMLWVIAALIFMIAGGILLYWGLP